jgi:hypothetical protein
MNDQVVELLKQALVCCDISYWDSKFLRPNIEKVIELLQYPTPITPEQYREIEGEEYPDDGAVYFLDSDDNSCFWVVSTYGEIRGIYGKHHVNATDEEYDNGPMPLCVCAYNLKRPPPADWMPE